MRMTLTAMRTTLTALSAGKKPGVLKLGHLNPPGESGNREGRSQTGHVAGSAGAWLVLGLALAIVSLLLVRRRKSRVVS